MGRFVIVGEKFCLRGEPGLSQSVLFDGGEVFSMALEVSMQNERVDALRNAPLYSQTEAAQYLNLPKSTLRYWAIGESTAVRKVKPLIGAADGVNKRLSFFNLVELHILNSLRRDHKIDLADIRKALDFVFEKLNVQRPLLEQTFETDGVHLFVSRLGSLINVSQEGQTAMREILKNSLARVERDSAAIPIKLFPYTHSEWMKSPRVISINPSLVSGRPVIDGTGIATSVIAERYKAGDSVVALADDFNLPAEKIEEAIRCELKLAA